MNAAGLLSGAAAVIASALGVIVLRTGPDRVANRRLAAVLGLEASFLVSQIALHVGYAGGSGGQPRWLEVWIFASIVGVSMAYLALLAILDTPLVAPFRPRAARIALTVFAIGMGVAGAIWGTPATMPADGGGAQLAVSAVAMLVFVGVAAYAIVVTVSAYRRTQRGTTAHAQARAFLAAFATRDSLWFLGLVLTFPFVPAMEAWSLAWWSYGAQTIVLLYVPLLAYGILRTQLFDIDLKIKVGIRRGTVVGIILIAVFVAAKVVEVYLNRTVGVIAGSVVAGSLLFLVPKLNKLGEKVASTALPNVQNTSAYVEFRKLEVYKAALESALETGELSDKERETLRRLRAKLGISEADANALEADVRERMDLPTAA